MRHPIRLAALWVGLAACETRYAYLPVVPTVTQCRNDVFTYELDLLDPDCDLEITFVYADQGTRERVIDLEGNAIEVCAYPVTVRDRNPFGDCLQDTGE
jgi:hypothetical protein